MAKRRGPDFGIVIGTSPETLNVAADIAFQQAQKSGEPIGVTDAHTGELVCEAFPLSGAASPRSITIGDLVTAERWQSIFDRPDAGFRGNRVEN